MVYATVFKRLGVAISPEGNEKQLAILLVNKFKEQIKDEVERES